MIPARTARAYLEATPSLTWLIVGNLVAMLVGIRFYVGSMDEVHTFLWPLYLDSPTALLLMALSLTTLLPFLGRDLDAVPDNVAVRVLHTLAFAWLVKYGFWTIAALNVGFTAYYPDLWGYWGIIGTHLLFVGEAYLIPHYATTTRRTLGIVLVALLAGDVADYVFGLHPPLRYEPGLALPVISVALSGLTVLLAARALDRSPTR